MFEQNYSPFFFWTYTFSFWLYGLNHIANTAEATNTGIVLHVLKWTKKKVASPFLDLCQHKNLMNYSSQQLLLCTRWRRSKNMPRTNKIWFIVKWMKEKMRCTLRDSRVSVTVIDNLADYTFPSVTQHFFLEKINGPIIDWWIKKPYYSIHTRAHPDNIVNKAVDCFIAVQILSQEACDTW